MKKTIFLIVLGVVTVFCIIYGTTKHVGGTFRVSGFPFIRIGNNLEDDNDNYNEEKRESMELILEKFSSIRINATIMELKIEEGEQFKLESTYTRDLLKPECSVNNGVLEVSQPKQKNGVNGGNNNCRVIITIPNGTKLSDIDINSNVGDIKLRKLIAETIDIDLNVGEVSVRDVEFEKIDVDNNVGEISIYPEGNIDDYSISVSTDVGGVRVGGKHYKRNYNSKGNGKKRIRTNTNVGEVNIR